MNLTNASPFQLTYDTNPTSYTNYVNNPSSMWLPVNTTPPGGKGYHKFKHRIFTTATEYEMIQAVPAPGKGTMGYMHIYNPNYYSSKGVSFVFAQSSIYQVQFIFKCYFWDYNFQSGSKTLANFIFNATDQGLGPMPLQFPPHMRTSSQMMTEEFKNIL